jgi:hypothetical protein
MVGARAGTGQQGLAPQDFGQPALACLACGVGRARTGFDQRRAQLHLGHALRTTTTGRPVAGSITGSPSSSSW